MSDESAVWQRLHTLKFYATQVHECSYLPGRDAITLFADPAAPMDTATYSALARLGFRRSGEHVYRPHCPGCNACVPVRIPVDQFRPDRSQRRTRARNTDLRVVAREPEFDPEHFELYQRYLSTRHPGGGMDSGDPDDYLRFVTSRWSDTLLYEFRLERRLLAVAAVDHLNDGLSAVYTFFDPDESRRSLGGWAVLWQIEETHRRGLPWLYLGYWIAESPKMAYKTRYRPLQAYDGHGWKTVTKTGD